MGFGKKKTDAAQILGKLSPMAWEWEPLTEIQPLRDNAALRSELDDSGTVRSSGKLDTK